MDGYDIDKLARVIHKTLWESYFRNKPYKPLETIQDASPFLMAAMASIEEVRRQQKQQKREDE